MIYRELLNMSMGMVAVTGASSHRKPASTGNSVPAVQKTSFPRRD
jgi:hypothetical protein